MSLSRTGTPSGDPAPPAEPRRRFALRRGPRRALPAGEAGAPAPAAGTAPPPSTAPSSSASAPSTALSPSPSASAAPVPAPSVLRPVGPHFVIAPATARDDELSAAIGALRPVPDAVVVVAAAPDSAKVLRDRMADLGVVARARGAGSLVLAASGLAALAPNGRRPAEIVAERAGLPVVAPDGLVEITAAGNLKVTSPEGATEAASWWRCEAGAPPRRVRETIGAATAVGSPTTAAGAEPAVLHGPAGRADGLTAGSRGDAVRILRLPTGFWLTDPASRTGGPLPDLGLAAAPPGHTVLLIGTPDRPVLLPDDFADAVLSLPLGTDRPLVSAPWAAPDQLAALTGALAARTARPVQAAIGLPVLGPGGPTSRILDRHGRAGWEPFLLRLATAPGRPTTPAAWRNGGADWKTAGPAVFEAFPFWVLEAVPAGLWLRPEPPHVLTPRFRRPEPARPLLIVGERDRPIPPDVFEELGALLDRLPAVGAEGFGLLAHGLLEPSAERVARFVARMHELDWLGAEQPLTGPPAVAPVAYGIGGTGRPQRPAAAARPEWLAAGPAGTPAVPGPTATAALGPAPAAVQAGPEPLTGSEAPVRPDSAGPAPAESEPVAPAPVPLPTPVRATSAPATGTSAAVAPSRRTSSSTGDPARDPAAGPAAGPAGDPAGTAVGGSGTAAAAAGSNADPWPRPAEPLTRTATSGGTPGLFRVPEVPPVEPPTGPDEDGPDTTAAPEADEPVGRTEDPPTTAEPGEGASAAESSAGEAPSPVVPVGGPEGTDPPRAGLPESAAEAEAGPEAAPDAGPPAVPSPGSTREGAPPGGTTPEAPVGPPPARLFRTDEYPPPVTASSPADRDAVRTLLGEHYHRCTGRLEQLATRLPGLRSTSKDDLKPDLAAVLLHHDGAGIPATRADLVTAARSGDPALRPFLRCLGSGLRRLPSHHGAVLLGADPALDPESVLALYPAGLEFREPAPLAGLAAAGAELPGCSVEFLVWSATGRRTSVFDSGDGLPQAVFAPGTAFTVVGTVAAEADRPAGVLLRETGGDPAERDRSALTRLRSWLERRAAMPPAERPRAESPERFLLTPGVEPEAGARRPSGHPGPEYPDGELPDPAEPVGAAGPPEATAPR
ncbi:hypothetical protein PUR61_38445 [Streptomyces sp. BE20]|uniref:hypothetical protein n=1 Tax=Streptomyces sp. BE20 TaxID=3002525 RepID=UPI002E77DC1B|nr:hypothetical protein [Streptomyces sp. BE20]MEE1828018.1 hypothetical protein [Streptomyces sp. BE20]